ncbi:MAG: hypothetical protein D6753_08215 [Planctomycetota bacterium]|nr:MAG: hypothetical protein D6753_08215 [Planctomycetota bacterium]
MAVHAKNDSAATSPSGASCAGAPGERASQQHGGDARAAGEDACVVSAGKEGGGPSFGQPTAGAPLPLVRRWIQRLAHLLAPEGYFDRNRPPAILVSFVVHLILLLCLALLSFPHLGMDGVATQYLTVVGPDSRTRQHAEVSVADASPSAPPAPVEPIDSSPPLQAVQPQTDPTETMQRVLKELGERSRSASSPPSLSVFDAADVHLSARFAATGIEGRSADRRAELARARGGTRQSEAAVERALAWLAEHQLPSGGWSLLHDRGRCDGRCRNPGSPDRFDPAATGLSLLAFLGAGYTHRDGKYRETVRRGIYFLMQVMEETPYGGSFLYQSPRGMYNHGIASFALCEAYQMTGDPDLREAAQKAIAFTVSAQHYHGSWGYLPQQPGDLTITGWQVMALKSAQAAGLDFPENTVWRIDPFLQSQMAEDGVFFGYTRPGQNNVCTAIGNLLRLFRGTPRSDPKILAAIEHFQRLGPSGDDIYYNYYASLLLFHMGGESWRQWNPRMRDFLVSTQATEGHERGSWYFENHFGRQGGRLYTTAMAAMTLEVYYRFAPLYQHEDEPFEL